MKMNNTGKPKLPGRIRNHVNPLSDQTDHVFEGFNNTNPIIIDIGSYRGEFIEQLVEKFGDAKDFLACEIRKPYAAYLKELFSDKENVAVFDGDSARNFKNLLKVSQDKGILIEYVFINFPDPWFKDKHKKRRVINANFLEEAKSWINPETQFIFQTDQEQLFRETQELLDEQGIEYTEFDKPLWNIQTHWEVMKIKEDNSIYRMKFALQNGIKM